MSEDDSIQTTNNQSLPYRLGVGIMLINESKQVFVGKRLDQDPAFDFWQMPQGGVEHGEDAIDAAMRELKEEIGTDNVEVLDESMDWFQYDIPDEIASTLWEGKYRGQLQKWFLCRLKGGDDQINVHTDHPEFTEWRWEEPSNLIKLIVPFKQNLYLNILDEFSPVLSNL